MKTTDIFLRLCVIVVFCSCCSIRAGDCFDCPDKKCCNCAEWGTGVFLPRPQAQYWPAFFNPYLYSCLYPCERNHSFFAGYRYSQSMKSNRIARCIFGEDVRGFSGSEVPMSDQNDWLADDFGLSPLFLPVKFFSILP